MELRRIRVRNHNMTESAFARQNFAKEDEDVYTILRVLSMFLRYIFRFVFKSKLQQYLS